MNHISIEVLPFIYLDCLYNISRAGIIRIIGVSINGILIQLSEEQKKIIAEEINIILQNDFDQDPDNDINWLYEN